MTVRWKPLLLLSGLFLVIAVASLLTFVYMTRPDAAVLLTKAQEQAAAGQFANAEIHYQRALQLEPTNSAIHEEFARMYEDWIAAAEPTQKAELVEKEIRALKDARKYGKEKAWPLERLLDYAMQQGQTTDAVDHAKNLVALNPQSSDAHYVLGLNAMDSSPPDRATAEVHLKALEGENPRRARTDWLAARIAGEGEPLAQLLAEIRDRTYAPTSDLTDQLAAVKLRSLDAQAASTLEALMPRVASVLPAAKAIPGALIAPTQLLQLKNFLEDLQGRLSALSAKAPEGERKQAQDLAEQADKILDDAVAAALKAAGSQDLRFYQIRAEHLLFRGRRDDCLAVIADAVKAPTADSKQFGRVVLALKDVGIKAALSDSEDKDRFEKAAPYVRDLLAADQTEAYYIALGHLYRGAMDLERSGLGGSGADAAIPVAEATELRNSALDHLKQASAGLPSMASAQALYGIALLLSKEAGLGRQYLYKAQSLGSLEARYQLWAAWSMIQAGYPEDAARIAASLEEGIRSGKLPPSVLSAVRLLQGECAQAARTPEDLNRALAMYEESTRAGEADTPALRLRKAQVYILLGRTEKGAKSKELIEKGLSILHDLRKSGEGGPSAEQLAVLTLAELERMKEARDVLGVARKRYPDSGELATLDAGLLIREGKSAEADKLLAEFLQSHPNDIGAAEARAKLLASDEMKRPDDARALLSTIADRSQSSSPLIQLADLDLAAKNYDGIAKTVARIRERWPEAAAADLIEGRVAVERGDLANASAKFSEALKKDPTNKVALFWKAQIDSATGAVDASARVFETIAREGTTKELQDGLSLRQAAEGALISQALRSGELDNAIQRIQDLIADGNGTGTLARNARWQLAGAYAAKGEWAKAKAELTSLLEDKEHPATDEERIRGAKVYRRYGEPDTALAILDSVLKADPGYNDAAILKALTLYDQDKLPEGAEALRKGIAASKEPIAEMFLVLAAFEDTIGDEATRHTRALKVLDEGLLKHKNEHSLVEARYRVLKDSAGPDAAVSYIESVAPSAERLRQLLIAVYRDQKRWEDAERAINDMLKSHPDDRGLTLALTQVRAARADQAAAAGDTARARRLEDEAVALLRQARTKFPNPLEFIDQECDMAARRGDLQAALSLTREMDQADKLSPAGALKRARLLVATGRPREAVQALKEAVDRDPRRQDARAQMAQLLLRLGEPAEALAQTNAILDRSPGQEDASLLKAQALLLMTGSVSQVAGWREEAANILKAATAKNPKLSNGYSLLADARILQDRRPEAISALQAGLKAIPNDPPLITSLIYRLTEPRGKKGAMTPATAAELAEAQAQAKKYGAADRDGTLCLALAMGFGKADQVDLALPWAEQATEKAEAARKSDQKMAPPYVPHLSLGSLLMTKGDKTSNPQESRAYYEQAAAEYDKVIQVRADIVEAVNNRAWILHKHLGEHEKALEVANGLMSRSAPQALPAEFLDTVGSIQEAVNQPQQAEETYAIALKGSPDSPILNFRLGRLLANDPKRSDDALAYLRKAEGRIAELRPEVAKELKETIARLSH